MNSVLLAIYDQAAGRYLDPFVSPSIEFAIRSFREAANDPEHQFARFPGDYTLFKIGEFDPETGQLTGNDPQSLGVAITFVDRSSIPYQGDAANGA